MTRIICLANSLKRSERCIAGIEPSTGRWIRPVTAQLDGRVPRLTRLVAGAEPRLLDLLEIPLADTGPDFGFESENRLILPGAWRRVGRAQVSDLLKYRAPDREILHTATPYVTVPYMQSLPPEERRTLQLVETTRFSVRRDGPSNRWKGTLTTRAGQRLTAHITDPVLMQQLAVGYRPSDHCLVTVSLSMPWRPPDWDGDDPCWKLIASAIDLDPAHSSAAEELDLASVPF